MTQYEQDWLELGFRFAKAMHYQHRRNLRLAEGATPFEAEGWTE